MNGIVPPGYEARFLGSATTLEELNLYAPLEESTPEGSLMLMRLDFEDFPSEESLENLNQSLVTAGVPSWPGNNYVVYADVTQPSIYLAWVKGMAFITIIIGIIAITVLPAILGAFVWWIIPQAIKDLIVMGGMMLIMFGMIQLMKPMLTKKKEGKKEG